MEFTQENAFEMLRNLQSQRQREINKAEFAVSNNAACSLNPNSTSEDVTRKQKKFYRNLHKHINRQEPADYLTPRTSALHAEVLHDMKQEIKKMKALRKALETRLSDIEDDITGLKKKLQGLKDMRQMHLNTPETTVEADEQSLALKQTIAKKLFKEVKADLHAVVDTMFPSNTTLKEVLAEITQERESDRNGGYVTVTPDVLQPVSFLIEAGIVQFNKNDKTLINVCDL